MQDNTKKENTRTINNADIRTYNNQRVDRNFDEVADHFAKNVYGGLKGDIRLAVLRSDLFALLEQRSKQLGRPLKILDIGAGFAQLSIELAILGHQVTVNDISTNMLEKAKERLNNEHIANQISWLACPYQELEDKLDITEQYDAIFCHAVLEWLANPQAFISFSSKWLANDGYLSLCFYNPASFTYRNLIMGNFKVLNKANTQADNKKSLTPNHPVDRYDVYKWLTKSHFKRITESGLRVFHDYALEKRGGHINPEAVIALEIEYSSQEPFKWLGRYLHVLSQKKI